MARGLGKETFGLTAELQGDEAILRRLQRFKPSSMARVIRPAVRSALIPVRKAAKRNAPVSGRSGRGANPRDHRPGALRRSIISTVKTYRGSGFVWGGVGPKKGAPDEPGRRIHWVEFGRPLHNVPAQPFLRPALENNRPEVNRILKRRIWEGIEKEAAKL